MKALISKLVIASILSITLVAVTNAVPHFLQKSQSCSSAKMTQAQPLREMPAGSYSTAVNTLYACSWR